MANRGISANIFTPAFLSGDFSTCRSCEVRAHCYDKEDVLESAFPGSYQTTKALAFAVDNPAARAGAIALTQKLTLFDLQGIEQERDDQ
jgi:hypothetical protein